MNGNIMHGHWQAEAISASSQAHTFILMDGPDISDIELEIMKSKILDWDPQRWRIVGTIGYKPEHTLEDGWNTDDDLQGLSAAIDNCKIVESSRNHVETTKGRRGRPKKRVVQRRGYIYLTLIYMDMTLAFR
jgi:hypothetical protein